MNLLHLIRRHRITWGQLGEAISGHKWYHEYLHDLEMDPHP